MVLIFTVVIVLENRMHAILEDTGDLSRQVAARRGGGRSFRVELCPLLPA